MNRKGSETESSGRASNRLLVQKFAAHLAHLLNEGEDVVEVSLFALYQRLLRTLAGAESGTTGARYRDGLTGFALVGADGTPDEVAQKYFDCVLDRPLHLARDKEVHMGHALFLALCRRGLDPLWEGAGLVRHSASPPEKPQPVPPDFGEVDERLGRLEATVSKGNPALATREKLGALYLNAGAGTAEVAEELAVWKAVSCGPSRLRKLEKGAPFNRFCSVVIKAVEAANAPYGAILSLGLSPFDWGDVLTVNTAKKVSTFLNAVREDSEGDAEGRGNLADWQRAWRDRKVPGFKTADDFWHSELGRALRHPQVPRRVEQAQIEDASDLEGEVLEAASFGQMVETCLTQGVLDSYDAWFLRQLFEGAAIDELAQAPGTKKRFTGGRSGITGYVTQLRERVLAHARRLEAMDGAGDVHPDKESEQPVEGTRL